MIDKFLIGSDIEYFLQDKNTQEIVSAENIIKGTKHDPFHFDKKNKYFATSLDNVMAEGNIPPAKSASEFYESVDKLMKHINSVIPAELTTVCLPSARLDYKWLQTETAQMFGCDPSFNCWTGELVHPQPTGDNVRSTGFHVHVGYDKPNETENIELARAMDLFLGLPAVIMEPANERKLVGYGLAGNFRHQRHGMEYRSLSGFFSSSKELIEWCYNQAVAAIDFVNSGRLVDILHMGDDIQRIINTEDRVGAVRMVNQFQLKLA